MNAQLRFWLLMGLLVLVICWSIGARQRLKRLHTAAGAAFVVLDRELCGQIDFVRSTLQRPATDTTQSPALAADAQKPTLALGAAADQLAAVLVTVRAQRPAPAGMAALSVALAVFLQAWQRLNPDTGAAVVLLEVDPLVGAGARRHWPAPSAAAELSRADFNRAVVALNAALRQFPASLLAPLLGLRQMGALT